MTNSFFQMWVHPDGVHPTTVNTHFSLYKWLAMPMGLKNAPLIHQCCESATPISHQKDLPCLLSYGPTMSRNL